MADEGDSEAQAASEAGTGPELDARQLDQLSDLVYALLRDELIVNRERRGEGLTREWR